MIAKNQKLKDEALEILSYLHENPNSMDTIEGLLHWWMLERSIKKERDSLKSIIDELIDCGFICEEKDKYANKTYYRLNSSSIQKIKELLSGDFTE